jgi:hypothetical protein
MIGSAFLLEMEVKRKLHLTHGHLDICDLPSGEIIDCGVWISEVHVVEHIEGFGSEFKRFAFHREQILRDG